MQIYKAYFKILNRNRMSMLIYFIIFVVLSIIVMNALKSQTAASFNETKNNIVIYNDDVNSPLTDGLRTYITATSNIMTLPDNTESIQDALFYGNVNYVLRIPAGFTQSFLSGNDDVKLQKTVSSLSTISVNMDLLINKYLNIASLYEKNMPGVTQSDLVGHALQDLAITSTVNYGSNKQVSDTSDISYYFRFNAYSILAILIMGIMTIMLTFSDPDLNRRNLCSPTSTFNINLQIFLGNAIFALAVWAALCGVNFLMYGSVPTGPGIVLLCANSLAFTIVSLSIGFLAGKFVKSHVVMSAVTNVISLGVCFLSGVFVDQEMLGSSVQTISSFTPGYWYIKAVNTIRDMSVYSAHNITPVIYYILIELGFAAACIIIALVATKQKRQTLDSAVW